MLVYLIMKEEKSSTEIIEQFNQINDCLTLFKLQLNSLQKMVNEIEKDVKKEISKKIKNEKENKTDKKVRKPSGFAKPGKVSDELCEFMDIPKGSEIARTQVTKRLVEYIKENKLSENKNIIVPDEKLTKLLDIDDETKEKLTYFTLQKHMNKHFIKNVA